MSGTSWDSRTETDKARIEVAFGAQHAADIWLDPVDAGKANPAAMPALYRAAADPIAPIPASLAGRLATDPRLRADFDRLLQRMAACRMGRAAAASTGSLDRREAGGYVLRIKPSRADPSQVYLLIDIPAQGTVPQAILTRRGGEVLKRALEAPQDGTVRLVLETSDPLVAAIGDPATEIDLV